MSTLRRRSFLCAAAVGFLPPAARAKKLPLGFSTLGCPKWEWQTILDQATASGYAALELRGVQGEMDLSRRPEFAAGQIRATRRQLEERELVISDLGASSRMHEPDPAKRQAQLDEGKRFIDLAHSLGVPYIRVFGDKWVPGEARRATIDRVRDGLRTLGEHGRGSGVTVLIESHGDFTDSATLTEILDGLPATVALLWDAHHTAVAGNERPADTFARLGRWVRHTHLKDSKPDGKGGHAYVLTGEGTVPVRDTVRVLARAGYRGFYNFEWEKAWHPEIAEPEVAIPHFAKVMRGYLADAGVK